MKNFVKSFRSRKLTLVYLSVLACIAIAFYFSTQIEGPEELLYYLPDHDAIKPSEIISAQLKKNDSLTTILGSLFLAIGGLVGGYGASNVYQKKVEGNDLNVSIDYDESGGAPDEADIED